MDERDNVGQLIRAKRELLGWSQDQLAEVSGTNQSTIDRLERGLTKTSKHISKIMLALNLEQSQPATLPVVGYVGGGQEVFAIDDFQKGDGIDHIEAPPGVTNGIALIIRGDSMSPKYEDGEIVIIEKVILDLRSLIGRICYIKLSDGRCYLKRLIAGSAPGRYTLQSTNGPAIPDVAIEQAYPISWVRPRR